MGKNDIMVSRILRPSPVVLCLAALAGPLSAQQPAASPDSLAAGIRRLAARLDSLDQGSCPALSGPRLPAGRDSLSTAVRQLAARLDSLVAARCRSGAAAGPPAQTPGDELAALRNAAREAAATVPAATADTTRPVEFVGRQRNTSALNPDISATGDLALVVERGSPPRDNALAREFEIAFQSTLDPYSAAKIFLTLSDEEVGVEEGYLYWTGLPGRLRLDAGRFRQPVGDLNRWHTHALPQSDYPLVYQRYLGEEGLFGTGVSLYTTLPVSIGRATHEFWLQGVTAPEAFLQAGSAQPLLLGRLQNFWQLSRSSYMQLGVTGAGGNNADSALSGRLVGADFRFSWRPPDAATRRGVTIRAEGYRLRTDQAGAVTTRYGGFAALEYRASRRLILGWRGDWLETPRGPYGTEWQITPNLTWWQSEFVYLRLEGRRHRDPFAGTRNQLLLQTVFAMGPHKHETY